MTDEYTKQTLYSLLAGIKAKQSQMIVGNPGLGKSALVTSLAKMTELFPGYKIITIIGSQKEPTDITGFPRLVDKPLTDGNVLSVTEYAVQSWQFEIMQYKKVFLFLDEFSNSTPAVQASMLQMLNEREFPNGQKMPDETIIIGAMNPVETATDGYELAPPVANRLKFLPWEPPFSTWADGMLTNWGHPEAISKTEMEWRKKVISFLKSRPTLVYKLPSSRKGESNAGRVYGFNDSYAEGDIYKSAYPSNRSWTNLCKELPYCFIKKKTSNGAVGEYNYDLMSKIANGIVGYEASLDFINYVKNNRSIPAIEKIVENPRIIQWNKINPNSAMTIMNEAKELSNKPEYIEPVANLFIYVANAGQARFGSALCQDILNKLATQGLHDKSKEVISAYSSVSKNMR